MSQLEYPEDEVEEVEENLSLSSVFMEEVVALETTSLNVE
jgi:hypothetical protein